MCRTVRDWFDLRFFILIALFVLWPGSVWAADFHGKVVSVEKLDFDKMAEQDWADSCKANTVQAYQHFLEQWDDSKYTGQAQARLNALLEPEARRKWTRTRQSNTIADYLDFLEKYSTTKYAVQAKARLTALRESAARQAWAVVTRVDTTEAYRAFQKQHSESRLVVVAEDRIAALEKRRLAEAAKREPRDEQAHLGRPSPSWSQNTLASHPRPFVVPVNGCPRVSDDGAAIISKDCPEGVYFVPLSANLVPLEGHPSLSMKDMGGRVQFVATGGRMALANPLIRAYGTWTATRTEVIGLALTNAGIEQRKARPLAQSIETLYFVQHKHGLATQQLLSALPDLESKGDVPARNDAILRWLAAMPDHVKVEVLAKILGYGYWALEDDGHITPATVGGVTAYVREIKISATCRNANGETDGGTVPVETTVVFDKNQLPRTTSNTVDDGPVLVAAAFEGVNEALLEAAKIACVTVPREVAKSRVVFSILGNGHTGLKWLPASYSGGGGQQSGASLDRR